MRLRNSFWALLGHDTNAVPTKVLESVRLTMLLAIDEYCDSPEYFLDDRINFAKDLDSLWYLRTDLSNAIARNKGESCASETLAKITKLFKGYQPHSTSAEKHKHFERAHDASPVISGSISFEWNDAYKIGDPVIDEHHQTWFEHVNSFLTATDKKSLLLCELKMLQYTRVHFESEEALMFSINYPAYAEHAKQHKTLQETLKKISVQIASDSLDLNVWKSFLSVWLLDHIRNHDTKLANYVTSG
jgi:hemerythrin-like metal-binding protein